MILLIDFNTSKCFHVYLKDDMNRLKYILNLNYIYKPMVMYNAFFW